MPTPTTTADAGAAAATGVSTSAAARQACFNRIQSSSSSRCSRNNASRGGKGPRLLTNIYGCIMRIGIRPTNFTYAQFLSQWQALAAAITNTVPGWAVTNAGNGWTLTGPPSAYNTGGYTVPFAGNEAGVISMVTQHYYRANGQSPSSTLALLLQPDTSLPGTVSTIVAAATAAGTAPWDFAWPNAVRSIMAARRM